MKRLFIIISCLITFFILASFFVLFTVFYQPAFKGDVTIIKTTLPSSLKLGEQLKFAVTIKNNENNQVNVPIAIFSNERKLLKRGSVALLPLEEKTAEITLAPSSKAAINDNLVYSIQIGSNSPEEFNVRIVESIDEENQEPEPLPQLPITPPSPPVQPPVPQIPPENEQHTICANQACVVVSGSGTNQCTSNAGCENTTTQSNHTTCSTSNTCIVISGSGTNACTINADCAVNQTNNSQTHSICTLANACVSVPGAGTNQCTTNADCVTVVQNHTACSINHTCVVIPGVGSNQCTSNSDCQTQTSAVYTIYVATNGNDAWSGKLAVPNAANTDGPFATLEAARNAIRQLKQTNQFKKPVIVYIREGTYYRTTPFVLESQDSGTGQYSITYSSYPNEKAIISGGRVITGWTQQGNLWKVQIPQVQSGEWYFNQLFVNNQRRLRARTPNQEYYKVESFVSPSTNLVDFYYQGNNIQQWNNLNDVVVVLYHSWTESHHYITSVDTAQKKVSLIGKIGPYLYTQLHNNQRYYLENALEFLDTPGEWYLNRDTGVLYYYPMLGETISNAKIIAPAVTRALININGNPESNQFVNNIHLVNLSFQHTDAFIPRANSLFNGGQAANKQEGTITVKGLYNGSIEGCEIAHVGEYGIWLRAGSKLNKIQRCHIYDTGAGGIRVGEETNQPTSASNVVFNTIDNNFIHSGGHIFRGAVGIWVGRSSYNTLSHNEISDSDYSGISVGWSWGYDPSSANHNIIEYNHIHNLMRGVLDDGGAIYTLGVSPGTIIRNNLIHDIKARNGASGRGLYNDQGSSYITMENNIVYNVQQGYMLNYGKNNIVKNNVFALFTNAGISRFNDENVPSFNMHHNIIYGSSVNMTKRNWNTGTYTIDNNFYASAAGNTNLDFAGLTFSQWQAQGRDTHSVIASPQFVNPNTYNFNLQSSSPALSQGFTQIDTSQVGLYGEPAWKNLPQQFPPRPDE